MAVVRPAGVRKRKAAKWPFIAVPIVVVAGVAAIAILTLGPENPPPPPPPSPPALPARVRVLLDSSASMAGYFKGRTEFKDFLATLIAGLPQLMQVANAKAPEITYIFAGEAGQAWTPFKGSGQELIANVLDERIMVGGSSMLQEIVARISKEIRPDEVDLLVTDGIFSYPSKDVQRTPSINRDNIKGLATQVQMSFQDPAWTARKMTPALGVLQYLSNFQGTYFTYRNDRLSCCNAPRPFYMWIVGDASRVAATFNAVRGAPGLRPQHAVLLGVKSRRPDARILTYTNRMGTWLPGRDGPLSMRQVPGPGEAQFTVALNLGDLPDDLMTPAFVLKNMTIDGGFASVTPVGFFARQEFASRLNPRDASTLAGATHFLVLKVTGMPVEVATVSVAVADALPPWCAEATTDDDTAADAPNAPPRTFGFLPVVDTAAVALRGRDPLFQFKVILER